MLRLSVLRCKADSAIFRPQSDSDTCLKRTVRNGERSSRSHTGNIQLSQSTRRRRGKGRGQRSGGRPEFGSMLAVFDREEDSATFWKRSNARLGIDDGMGEGKGKAPVEHPCAVCGVIIALDRMPNDRHDVICSSCRGALGGMYDDDDREAANSYVRAEVEAARIARRSARDDPRRPRGT